MVDLTEVILTDGKVIHCEAELGLASLDYKFGSFPVREKSPISLTVENAGGKKLLISGSARLTVEIPCARCLEGVASGLEIQFDLDTESDSRDYIDGYSLDVDQIIHDEALLAWPERVLCKEDCKGLCAVCGHNLNEGSCGCDQSSLNPQMARILDVFSNFKEV